MSQNAISENPKLTQEDAEMLGRHLADEAATQQEVLGRLVEQERLLARHDVNGLKKLLIDSDPMLARLQALTEMRLRIMSLLGKRLGVPADSVSVTRVLADVPAEHKDRLDAHAAGLRKVLGEVEKRTRRVNVLLRCASETNSALLHGILGDAAPLRPYQPDGSRAPSSGLPHFAREI
jgi:FlgN protein